MPPGKFFVGLAGRHNHIYRLNDSFLIRRNTVGDKPINVTQRQFLQASRINFSCRIRKIAPIQYRIDISYRFDPNMLHGNFMFLGIGYYLKGDYKKAINVLKEGMSRKPSWVGNHIVLAAAYAQSGRRDDAEREVRKVFRLNPFFDIDNYGTVFRNQTHRDKIVQGLREAGLN